MAEHITEVYFLNVPLESDYKNTIYFTTKANQESYFKSRVKKQYLNGNTMSYQRKDGFIRVDDDMDTLLSLGINYVMYQNKAFSNKWFYAFITDMKYVSPGRTDVYIETDCMQTWLFDFTVKPSFIEREHVSDDTIGKHTVPENLETGEYICNEQIAETRGELLCIYLAISDFAGRVDGNVQGNMIDGIYSGMCYEVYECSTRGVQDLNGVIAKYDNAGKADAIHSIFMGPGWLAGITDADEGFTAVTKGVSWEPITYNPTAITKPTTINGYKPRHKKLLCYPFNYLYVSNNNGATAIYHYELFNDDVCNFEVNGCLTPGCSIRMHPLWYKGIVSNYDEGINGGKFPICSWNSDAYTNWLTQNGVNNAISYVSGAASVGLGIGMMMTGGGAGIGVATISSGVATITQTLAKTYQASLVPDQVRGNTNSGDVITASKINNFIFHKMSIREEYAKILDDYFHMYGYQVNKVKLPNKAHRGRWWYTKTIDVNIDGAIPNKDMQVIKDCYNRGITFWRNSEEIQKYNLSNGISLTSEAVTEANWEDKV